MKKIFILCFIILSLLWVNFCISYFGHYHVAEDGTLVFHAHPYPKSGKPGSTSTHSHAQAELAWSASLIHALSLLFFCSIFRFLVIQRKQTLVCHNYIIPQKRFQTASFVRAPPFLLA